MLRIRPFGLALSLLLLADAANPAYQIEVSSQTILNPAPNTRPVAKKKVHKHPIRQAGAGIKRAIKKSSPNPRVQSPGIPVMPPQAPQMPHVQMPAAPPPPKASGTEKFFSAAAKVMTHSWRDNLFVWLPAISTDPNAGPTYGILPVLVITDQATKRIRHLLAPSYTYNSLFGQTGTMRYYWYPTDSSQLYANGSYSQHTNRELKLRYENTAADEGLLYLRGEAYYNVDASQRFYGFGPQSPSKPDTGYTGKASVGRGSIGVNFGRAWRASFGTRFERFATAETVIPNTVDLAQRFPDIPGIGTNNTVANEFRLLWDTRDSPVTPSHGSSGELFTEKTSKAMGSNADFFRYGLEGKRFFTWKNPKQVTVLRGLYEQCNGPNIPFYEMPQLGGRTTLRGFGDGRFTDQGRLVANVEQRMTFASIALMGIQTNFEVAPFVDAGSVFHNLEDLQAEYVTPVYGAAFRVAVKPNVVGDVELGVGKEGPAVFVDINYPF